MTTDTALAEPRVRSALTATREKLRGVFEQVFGEAFDEFPDSISPRDVRKWDSNGNVDLLLAIEEAFGLEFQPEEFGLMQNVGQICQLIEVKSG